LGSWESRGIPNRWESDYRSQIDVGRTDGQVDKVKTIVKSIFDISILYKVGVYIYMSESIAIRMEISEYGLEHRMLCWNTGQEQEQE